MSRTNITNDDIFHPGGVKTIKPVEFEVFTLRGYSPVTSQHDEQAYAYRSHDSHYLKLNQRHELLNALDTSETNTIFKQKDGMPAWQWKKVPRESFEQYVKFLNTQNIAFLDLARRALISEVH